METTTIRIRLTDYKQARKVFPAYKGETAQSWFFRLTKFLEGKRQHKDEIFS